MTLSLSFMVILKRMIIVYKFENPNAYTLGYGETVS